MHGPYLLAMTLTAMRPGFSRRMDPASLMPIGGLLAIMDGGGAFKQVLVGITLILAMQASRGLL